MQFLDYLRDCAEWFLKVYLSMEAESAVGIPNSYDLPWFGLKSKHFRWEV